MVGALDLSEKARLLEMAGKEGDVDYIKANNQDVLDLFDQVVAELKEYRKR